MLPWQRIHNDHRTFIIAEIGQNHQGNLDIAKQMITLAKECGADCVKFQKTDISSKFNQKFLQKPYDNSNSWGKTYGEHKQFLEFSEDEFRILQKYARENDVLFTASAMDLVSLKFLASLQVPFIKIGSGDANNLHLIEEAAKLNIPLVISTGMVNRADVMEIYRIVSKYHKMFCLLHCISSYPTPISQVNLSVIGQYQLDFPDIDIGYSGHEMGVDISVAAVVCGAKVNKAIEDRFATRWRLQLSRHILERHFTLNKQWKGSDHCCSLDPQEMKLMVQKIRLIETAIGNPIKSIQPCEESCINKLQKTLVVKRNLSPGEILDETDVDVKVAEPKGIDGSFRQKVIGKKVSKYLQIDQSLTRDCLVDF